VNYGGDHKVCPMLGFPDEQIVREDYYPYYVCRPTLAHPAVVAAVWWSGRGCWFVRLYKEATFDKKDGVTRPYGDWPDVKADDPLHAQAIIFHLIQTHLPREVTDNAA